MERYYSINNLKDTSKSKGKFGLKNSFCLPLMSFFSCFYDSCDILTLIERFSEAKSTEILSELGLSDEELEIITKRCLLDNIKNGVSEIGLLALNPRVVLKACLDFEINATIYVRIKDVDNIATLLEEFKGQKIKLGLFVDPYVDGDDLTNKASELSGKYNLPVVCVLFDDIKKTGMLNSLFDTLPVNYIEDVGLLDRDCSILGGIYADKDDFSLIASYGAKIIVSPHDSLNLGKGIANLQSMQNSGVEVNLASLMNSDIVSEISLASMLCRSLLSDPEILPVSEVLEIAISKYPRLDFKNEIVLEVEEKCEKIYEKIKEKI